MVTSMQLDQLRHSLDSPAEARPLLEQWQLRDHAGALAQLPALLEGRARTLDTLLQLFSTSQFFSDLLVTNPDYVDMLRVPLRSSPNRAELQDQLQAEVDAAFE